MLGPVSAASAQFELLESAVPLSSPITMCPGTIRGCVQNNEGAASGSVSAVATTRPFHLSQNSVRSRSDFVLSLLDSLRIADDDDDVVFAFVSTERVESELTEDIVVAVVAGASINGCWVLLDLPPPSSVCERSRSTKTSALWLEIVAQVVAVLLKCTVTFVAVGGSASA